MDFRLYLQKEFDIKGLVAYLAKFFYLKEDPITTVRAPCREKGIEQCFVFDIKAKRYIDSYIASITPAIIAGQLEMEVVDEVVIPDPEFPEEPRYIVAVKKEDFNINEKLKKKLKFDKEGYEARLSILMERLETFGSVASISSAHYPVPDDITDGAVMVLLESKPPNRVDLPRMIHKKLPCSKYCISKEEKIWTPGLKQALKEE